MALVILYEIGSIDRFETVQRFASYARHARGDKESAGKKVGKGQAKMGNAYLKWAFSEVAVMFLRGNPDALKAVDSDEISVSYHDHLAPIQIRPTDGDNFLAVVMPMRF